MKVLALTFSRVGSLVPTKWDEIKSVLDDLRSNEEWFYPCFALWLGTGLRNAKVIGLTWECVRLDEGEMLISKTLRRDGTATNQRLWSGTKTGKERVVPLSQQVVEVLRQQKKAMQCLGLNTKDGLVFVTLRTHGHLYDSGLEKVWKRSQCRVGTIPMRMYD